MLNKSYSLMKTGLTGLILKYFIVTENWFDWRHSEIHFSLLVFFPYHQLGNIDPMKAKEASIKLVTLKYGYHDNRFICY